MALAMDARAYGFKPYRTSMFEYAFKLRDGVFLLVILCISIAMYLCDPSMDAELETSDFGTLSSANPYLPDSSDNQ